MSNFEFDGKQALKLFAELNSKQQKKAHRDTLRKSGQILAREARKQLKKVPTKNGLLKVDSDMRRGIKVSVDKEATQSKVHIMGDYRLKWFEMGTYKTNDRKTKKGYSRGVIQPSYFFQSSKEAKESEIFTNMDKMLSDNITKIYNKYNK